MSDSFYVELAPGRFASTDWTRGPWGPDSQHAGPPAALLGRAMELVAPRDDVEVARVTFEILGPIPIAELEVKATVARSGKSVELVEAGLSAGGKVVMKARGWRIRHQDLDLPDLERDPPRKMPEDGVPVEAAIEFDAGYRGGYLDAMEWSSIKGSFREPGPGASWVRMRVPLVEGEPVSPLCRVLAAADSCSGISSALDFRHWIFINTDLTVHLHRMPEGEWILLDAETIPERHGVGMCWGVLSDQQGVLGRTLQSLFIAPRRDR